MDQGKVRPESFAPPEPSKLTPWLVASAAAVAVLGSALILMKMSGLLDIPKDDTGAKTLAASLGLIGATLSAAVTLVGTVVKYSIDDRNARLAAVQARHNYALALDAEKRNRIEAAIRAVGLLSHNNADSTPHQIGGALLALVSLGEHDLAVALLSQLWPRGLVSGSVAGIVLSNALRSEAETQIGASSVLFQNAARIGQNDYHIWPIPEPFYWRFDLPGNCRLGLIQAAARWLIRQVTTKRPITTPVVVLYNALGDPDRTVRGIAAAALRPLCDALPPDWATVVGEEVVAVKNIAERLAKLPTEQHDSDVAVLIEREVRSVLFPATESPPPKSPDGAPTGD